MSNRAYIMRWADEYREYSRPHDIATCLFATTARLFEARKGSLTSQQKFTLGLMQSICERNVGNLGGLWIGTYQPDEIYAACAAALDAKGEK